MAKTILVIGSTGTVGSQVVAQLIDRGESVRAATRNPATAAERCRAPAKFVEFDFERPETFAAALEGADRVFLSARPGDEQADRVAIPLIDAMRTTGVGHVVNLTAMGAETRDDFALRKVERYLEGSGIGFTHLRPNWFMQIFTIGPLAMGIRKTGMIRVPAADARISFVDVRDVAATAAAALAEPGHSGKAYTLTGGQALDHREVAQVITEVSGRTIRYVAISDEAAREAIQAAGLSAERAERLLGFHRLVRAGFCMPISPDMQKVLGRAPISFERFARDHASCWS